MPRAVLEKVGVADTLYEAGIAGRVDDRVIGEVFVWPGDGCRAGDRAAVLLGGASLCDKYVVESGGWVVVEMGALGGAYSRAVVAAYGSVLVMGPDNLEGGGGG